MAIIIVVDDDPLVRALAARALASVADVRSYADAASAVGALAVAADRIELIVADVEMPGALDGIGLALSLSVTDPGIPVVLMSGDDGALALGRTLPNVRGCLHKPFTLAALRAAVEGGLADVA